jgi:hypothetical protein
MAGFVATDPLVADDPSAAELAEMHEVLLVMLRGLARGPDGSWQVDPGVAPLLGDIDPATAVKRVKRALGDAQKRVRHLLRPLS